VGWGCEFTHSVDARMSGVRKMRRVKAVALPPVLGGGADIRAYRPESQKGAEADIRQNYWAW